MSRETTLSRWDGGFFHVSTSSVAKTGGEAVGVCTGSLVSIRVFEMKPLAGLLSLA